MKVAARGHHQALTREECLARLGKASVGRLGVTIRALGRGGGLRGRRPRPVGAWAWSVLVQGIAEEVTDPTELAVLRTLRITPWAYPDGQADRFLRIDSELVSGRRFHRSEAFRP